MNVWKVFWPDVQLTTAKAGPFQSIMPRSIFYSGWNWYSTRTWWRKNLLDFPEMLYGE